MDWLGKVFSGGIDISRVNYAGVALLIIGLIASLLAEKLARKLSPNTIRIIALIIAAGGALLAILG